jgi:universal stress protein E
VDKKILVVVDPRSDAQAAVERAAWLATCVSADLELFICDFDPYIDAGQSSTIWIEQPVREQLIAKLREKLETLAVPLRDRGLQVSIDVAWDHPLHEGIVRKARESQPWLVAKDTHHHGVLKRTILTNTDWHLIRDCPAPLLLVKPNPVPEDPKVFAAVDPLHVHDKPARLDNELVKLGAALAADVGGELHVVHAYMVPIELMVPDASQIHAVVKETRQAHKEAFAEFLEPHAMPDGSTHLIESPVDEALPEITEKEGAWVIVMGAISRGGLERVFIGSTAERVLDRLPCDVLIVKPGAVL